MVYKVLPDVKIAWTDVWVGSAITALLFTLGKFLFGMYLARSTISSAYGAASSLAIILMWVYYSAQIFLIGAELTQVYANRYGSQVKPRPRYRVKALRKSLRLSFSGSSATEASLFLSRRNFSLSSAPFRMTYILVAFWLQLHIKSLGRASCAILGR